MSVYSLRRFLKSAVPGSIRRSQDLFSSLSAALSRFPSNCCINLRKHYQLLQPRVPGIRSILTKNSGGSRFKKMIQIYSTVQGCQSSAGPDRRSIFSSCTMQNTILSNVHSKFSTFTVRKVVERVQADFLRSWLVSHYDIRNECRNNIGKPACSDKNELDALFQ